jgi:diguanylate cyclase (GGDEF)-like protein/PAS domain S-box-containing protein
VRAPVTGAGETPTVPHPREPVGFHSDFQPTAVIDLAGRFVEANDAFRRDVGITAAELVGRHISDVWAIDPFASEVDLAQRMATDGLVLVEVRPSEQRPAAPNATLQFLPDLDDAGRWVGCSIFVVTHEVRHEKRDLSLGSEGFQLSFDQIQVGMLISGLDGFVVRCNPAMARLFGRTPAEIAETDVISMIHPDDRLAAIEQGARALNGEIDSFSHEQRMLAGDGSPVWVHGTSTVVRDAGGNALHFLSQFIDIRDRKRAEAERTRAEAERNRALDELTSAMEALRESEAEIKFLVDGTPVPLIKIDANLLICGANAALESLLERPPLGLSITEVVHADDLARLSETYLDLTPDVDWVTEIRVMRPDGTMRWVRSHGRIHHDDNGDFRSVTATWNDVTEARVVEELLRVQASTDALTGLANRATFFDRLTNALSRAARAGGLAVLFVDLDHFKPVNDRWGHETGDELLVHVAHRLNSCVREGDTVARIGGDEFVILAEPVICRDDAVAIARRIVETLARPYGLTGGTATITASVGLAMSAAGDEPRELVHRADLAAYQAKASGRSQLSIAPAQTPG